MANGSELALILEGGKTAHVEHKRDLREEIGRIGLFEMSAIAAPALAGALGLACAVVLYASGTSGAALAELSPVLAWFFAAVLLSVMVPGLSWLRHYTHALSLFERKLDFEEPFVHGNGKTKLLTYSGQLCVAAAVGAIVCSYGALLAGGIAFLDLMR
ncbi:hypothetical protein [Hoeflea prorocentri]|uniref:Uncharacterized protein n=1 Tax=Hoeflea prorocentri TaxID=1922333 RepID=A0A9X3ZGS5_9HYPH|nr:hypothetical protein [Hoeflea prorocentri]MCY6381087.1 hypothetical protein [Hoeflea prorocentri]MDA5398887.1 hypothetical protein [Hoeflea prorocentri]